MAKLQAVFKSETYLTEVEHVADKARYFIDSYIYDDPTVGYPVAVTGFINPTNNANGTITGVQLTAPMWFEIAYGSQVDETHDALARSSSSTGATCAQITKPGPDQALSKGFLMNSCNYHARNNRPKKGAKSRTIAWAGKMKGTPFDRTRQFCRVAANKWRRLVTPAQKALWETFAAGATIYSYDGGSRTPNGFEAFMFVCKQENILGFNPNFFNVKTWSPFVPTAPVNPWAAFAAPVPNTVTAYGDGSFGITFSNTPASSDIFVLGQIALPGTPHTRPQSWFAPWEPGQSLDQFDPDYESFWQTDFPFHPPGTNAQAELALFYFDGATYHWGPYSFLSLT